MGLILRSLVTCIFVTYVLGLELNFPGIDPCIMAHMNISFSLSYGKDTSKLSDPEVDTMESKCAKDGSLANLALKWGNSNDTMTIYFMKKTNKVEMDLLYKFIPKDHFKDLNDTGIITMNDSAPRELSLSNMSYKCNSPQEIQLNKTMYKFEIRMSNVQVQAFDVKNASFSNFEECSEDTLTTENPAPDTTTHQKLTTGPTPTTEPLQQKYKYPESGRACILLYAAIQFDIDYTDNKNKTATAKVDIPRSAEVTVTGECAKNDTGNASIFLEWNSRHSKFSMGMDFITDKEVARLTMVEVMADLSNEDYKLLHNKSIKVIGKKDEDLFHSLNHTYYFCNSHQEETFGKITVVIYRIQVQAFGVNNSDFTGDGTECEQDITTESATTATMSTANTTTATVTTANTTTATVTTANTTATVTTANTTATMTTANTTATVTTANTTATVTTANTTATMTTPNTTTPITPTTTISLPTNNYSVSDHNVTCIFLKAGMEFTFLYTNKNATNTSKVLSVPPEFKTDGTCDSQNDTTNKLNIHFYNNWTLSIIFGLDNSSSLQGDSKSTTYSVKSVTLNYQMDPKFFPEYSGNATEMYTAKTNITSPQFQSNVNGSYKCNSQSEVPFMWNGMMVKLETFNLQYKAFNKDNSTDFGGDLKECAADNSNDNKTNSIVPIAVGAALAGLVVIVLIAYLIGRRRNRKGYESV